MKHNDMDWKKCKCGAVGNWFNGDQCVPCSQKEPTKGERNYWYDREKDEGLPEHIIADNPKWPTSMMETSQKEPVEGWVEELQVEVLEPLFFLLKMEHLAKKPWEHMEQVRGEVEHLKAFISSLLEAERERILREMPNDTELLEIWVGFWRTFTHNNKRPPNMRESLSQMNSIIGQVRAIITKEQKP